MHAFLRSGRRGAALGTFLSLTLVLAACGGGGSGDGDDVPGGTATVENGSVEITADNLEFSVGTIEAPAGEPFTVVFTNLESAPHNWALYTEEGGEEIAQGDVIGQDETNEVDVPALEPGEYFFVCDVHPQQMTGRVVVGGG